MTTIQQISTHDVRFPLQPGEGVDAIHQHPVYSYATTALHAEDGSVGVGAAFTLGGGNDIVCQLAGELAQPLVGREVEELMAQWGDVSQQLADHPQLRWLGPHKGAVHLALASITNACFDLWTKARGVPLWRLLLDLSPQQILALLDLSYVEDELSADEVLRLVREAQPGRSEREGVIESGYPGYDTSVGWFNYPDELVVENARRTVDAGFTALKLKVGSQDLQRDLRRVRSVRETVGDRVTLMVDANQQWRWPMAIEACTKLAEFNLFWIEEPTHPDDVLGHRRLAEAVAPVKIAAGEHVPNRVVFKNLVQAKAIQVVQVDAVRVAGVSEFLTVSLLARKHDLPVVPHVGDMGQLHQHLVLFNHVGLGIEKIFLEYIPHLASYFKNPAIVRNGVYQTQTTPGSGFDFARPLA